MTSLFQRSNFWCSTHSPLSVRCTNKRNRPSTPSGKLPVLVTRSCWRACSVGLPVRSGDRNLLAHCYVRLRSGLPSPRVRRIRSLACLFAPRRSSGCAPSELHASGVPAMQTHESCNLPTHRLRSPLLQVVGAGGACKSAPPCLHLLSLPVLPLPPLLLLIRRTTKRKRNRRRRSRRDLFTSWHAEHASSPVLLELLSLC